MMSLEPMVRPSLFRIDNLLNIPSLKIKSPPPYLRLSKLMKIPKNNTYPNLKLRKLVRNYLKI